MDPSKYICQLEKTNEETSLRGELTPYSNEGEDININVAVMLEDDIVSEKPMYIDVEGYKNLQNMKDNFGISGFAKARLMANPFENIGRSVFMNRASIKLANIDAVFNLTQQKTGYIVKQYPGKFTFCDIGSAPGGFTEYLQYRRTESIGYGISLHKKYGGLPWKRDKLNMNQFNIYYGPDNSGNLYNNSLWFSNKVRDLEPNGVDLVTADGGLENKHDAKRQEILSSRLILSEILVALKTLKTGGNFVCKIFDVTSKISSDLIYLTSLCFREIHIIKPISSRPANAERYLVGLTLHENINEYINTLADAHKLYKDNIYVSQIFETLPAMFVEWLTNNNNLLLKNQIDAAKLIIDFMNGGNIDIPQYNLFKCLAIWNLPDNTPTKRDLIQVK